MNQAIANIIKNHISGLDFIDKIAGLVSACTFDIVVRDKENNPTTVQKTFPIACCLTEKCTIETAYQDLMPNSDYKTVIYFEDKGVSWVKTEGRYKHYTSNVRLVCWINVAKILGDTCKEGDTCTLSTHLITEIIRSLPEFPGHHNPFNMVFSEVTSQEVRSPSIFSTYTYDEKHSQYLMYPYDYFALDIQTSFAICMKGTQVYNADCSSTDLDNLDAPVASFASIVAAHSFTANWEAVTGATGYAIDVATDPGLTDFVLQDERVGNALSVSITNLDPGVTYYYIVRAYNDYTESENSNVINLTTSQSGQTTFNDYFLPSKDERNEMYTELHLYGLGGFIDDFYWSSTEFMNTDAYIQDFIDGTQGNYNKEGEYNVRACRAFTSTTNYNLRDIGPAGGYIFWKSGNNYLESAPTDCATSAWSNIDSVEIGVSAQGTAIGTGQANTTAIINQVGHTDSAAKLCNDLIVTVP